MADGDQVEKITFSNKLTMLQIGVSASLAVIGICLTVVQYQANEQRALADRQGKQLDSFFTLSMRCASDKESERAGMVKLLGIYYSNKAIEPNRSLDQVKDACSQLVTQGSAVPAADAKPAPQAVASTPSGPTTWVYLGTYQKNTWQTRYLEFPTSLDPSAYTSGSPGVFAVRRQTGALNVRTGDFSPSGAFPPVTASLDVGRRVRVLNTWQWFDSGNWWAKVEIL